MASASTAHAKVTCGSVLFPLQTQPLGDGVLLGIGTSFADIDGDGVQDLVAAPATVQYRTKAGAIRATVMYPPAGAAVLPDMTSIQFGDLDGDGGAEIIVGHEDGVSVLKADASGALRLLATIHAEVSIPLPVVGRFRNQSHEDLLLEASAGKLTLYSLESGTFSAGTVLTGVARVGGRGGLVAAGADLDGDGVDELLFPSESGIGVARLGTASSWAAVQDVALPGGYYALISADFDGDGRRDVAAYGHQQKLYTWVQTSPGTLTPIPELDTVFSGIVWAGDLDGDGVSELVTGRAYAKLSAGAWTFTEIRGAPDGVRALFDWNGDGLLDLIGMGFDKPFLLPGGYADLSITPLNPPASAGAGDDVWVSFTVTNNGPSAVTGILLSTAPGVSQLSPLATTNCMYGDCPDLKLAPGESITAAIFVDAGKSETALTVSACGTLRDPNSTNDSVTVTFPSTPQADLQSLADLSVADDVLSVGVQIANGGPSDARNVHFDLNWPEGGTIETWTSDPAGGTCSNQSGTSTCTMAALPSLQKWTMIGKGRLPYSGQSLTISGTAASDVADPRPLNNAFSMTLPAFSLPPGASFGSKDPSSSGCGCKTAVGSSSGERSRVWIWLTVFSAVWLRRRSSLHRFQKKRS